MRYPRRPARLAALVTAAIAPVLAVAACGEPAGPVVGSVVVTADGPDSLPYGLTRHYLAAVHGTDGALVNARVAWSVNNAAAATIDQAGTLVATGYGRLTVSAEAGGVVGTRVLRVIGRVGAVRIVAPSGVIGAGSELGLTAGVFDTFGNPIYNRLVTWRSLTPATAAPKTPTGRFTISAPGPVVIEAAADSATDTLRLTALPQVAGVTLSVVPDTVNVAGGAALATATARDSAGGPVTGYPVLWLSTDAAALAVDAAGHITATGLRIGPVTVEVHISGAIGGAAVAVATRLTEIQAGTFLPCVLTERGRIMCWRTSGGLQPVANPSPLPTLVSSPDSFVALATENNLGTACALRHDGQAACWNAAFGGAPALVPGGRTFQSLTMGNDYALGLAPDGAAWWWGTNGGRFPSATVSTTTPEKLATAVRFRRLHAAGTFNCGLGLDSLAYCWGGNTFGTLGVGDTLSTPAVRPVRGLSGLTDLTVSGWSVCALDRIGTPWCWGEAGMLPTYVQPPHVCGGTARCATLPLELTGLPAFAHVSTGDHGACGLTPAGLVICWAADEPVATFPLPQPMATLTLEQFSDNRCGLDVTGRALCFNPFTTGVYLVPGQR